MSLFELHRTDHPTPEVERAAIVANHYIDNPQIVSDTLYENGLHILTIKSQSITLEKFFFNLIGGGNKYV